jgi:hypothetical protein
MASNFPKLPGYVPVHDPTRLTNKRVSNQKQDVNKNAKNVPAPLYMLPRPPQGAQVNEKKEESKSLSQSIYKNHFGGDITEQFEPHFVKMDK